MTTATRAPAPLTVLLPAVPALPAGLHGRPYRLSRLLLDGSSNAKLARSAHGPGRRYLAFGLSLAPADTSGHQACASSSPGCRQACLFKQGRGQFWNVGVARIARAVAFFEHRDWFAEQLSWDVEAAARRARSVRRRAAIRLNVVSDLMWEKMVPKLFEARARFYDYTKHTARALRFARGDGPPNYDLTFSRSEDNDADCRPVLQAGGRVAVVFRRPPLPESWHGHRVIDGDGSDFRFLDPSGVVVGLKAKGSGKKDRSGFVVDADGAALEDSGPGKTDPSGVAGAKPDRARAASASDGGRLALELLG
jgi:hypothetical protein